MDKDKLLIPKFGKASLEFDGDSDYIDIDVRDQMMKDMALDIQNQVDREIMMWFNGGILFPTTPQIDIRPTINFKI